jgi:hypothetical protein
MNRPGLQSPYLSRESGWSMATTPSTLEACKACRPATAALPPQSPGGPAPLGNAWSLSPGASRIPTLRSGSYSMALARPKNRSAASDLQSGSNSRPRRTTAS